MTELLEQNRLTMPVLQFLLPVEPEHDKKLKMLTVGKVKGSWRRSVRGRHLFIEADIAQE